MLVSRCGGAACWNGRRGVVRIQRGIAGLDERFKMHTLPVVSSEKGMEADECRERGPHLV
jgi:hypothetical protein